MNPFVNQQPSNTAIRRFIHLLLFQAQQDHATELVIGVSEADGETPFRFKIEGTWRGGPPFPSRIRPEVIAELVRMAGFHAGQIPGEGVLDERLGNLRLRWIVGMTDAEGECRLVRVED